MGRRKRGGATDALDKAVGRLTQTAGTASGDKTLEAEGRATQRMGREKPDSGRHTPKGGGRYKSRGPAERRAYTRPKERRWRTTKNWRGATSRASSSSTRRTGPSRRSKPTASVAVLIRSSEPKP